MKKNLTYIKIAACTMAMWMGNHSFAQTTVQVGNITNKGTSSWGVSVFILSGNYTTAAGATDQFYNVANTALYLQGSGTGQFANLVLNTGANSYIENDNGITVGETLQSMGNIIYTGSNPETAIRLGNTATLNGSSPFNITHFIEGFLQKSGTAAFTFPLGEGGLFSPISFENPGGSSLRYKAQNPGNNLDFSNTQGANNLTTVSMKEYYIYNGSAPAGFSVTMPYNNFATDGYSGAVSKMTIAGWDGVQWMNLGDAGNSIDVMTGTVTITLNRSLSGIEKLTVGNTDPINILAASLQNFSVKTAANCGALFNWKLLADEALLNFELQQSNNGADYTALKTIAPNTGAAATTYSYHQPQVQDGLQYYRLKVTTAAGSIYYSDIIKLQNNCNKLLISISPNPVKDRVYISGLEAGYRVTIFDANGARIVSKKANGSTTAVDMQRYASGTYVVFISDIEGVIINKKKIIKP